MKSLSWNEEKSLKLKKERGFSFDDIIRGRFLGIESHPSRVHQRLMVFEVEGYVWVVPYVEQEGSYFLKTAFPSRKHAKRYLKGK